MLQELLHVGLSQILGELGLKPSANMLERQLMDALAIHMGREGFLCFLANAHVELSTGVRQIAEPLQQLISIYILYLVCKLISTKTFSSLFGETK